MNFYPMRILKETITYNLEEMNMTFFKKKNETKVTNKLPMTGKMRKGFKAYCTMVIMSALMIGTSTVAFAAAGDPLTVINNLLVLSF